MAVNVDVARAGNGQVGTVDIGVGKVNVARTGDFHDKLLRSNAVNADGTVLVGHSCWPGSGSNWSPVLWDLANDTSFYVGGEEDAFGTLLSVNAAGTIFGSYQTNIVYYYDRENMRVTSETMPFAPGCISGNVRAISDDGLVLVYQSNANYTGQLYAYDTHTKELTPFSTFVEELYGLESPATYGSALYISGTGRMMCGYTTYQGNTVPYCLMLDEHQILPRPRSFSALQQPGSSAVVMNWQAPLQGQYTVLGYNVFCDSVQINAEMIPVGESDYVQVEGIQSGLHEYAVQAVYAEGDTEVWKKYLNGMPGNWVIGEDKMAVKDRAIYDLKAMPTIYLLDKNKKVLLKDAPYALIREALSFQP